MKKAQRYALICAALGMSGCIFGGEDELDYSTEPPQEERKVRPDPPTPQTKIDKIFYTNWPPMNARDTVEIFLTKGRTENWVDVRFRDLKDYTVMGAEGSVEVTGAQLGEGIGEMVVRARNEPNDALLGPATEIYDERRVRLAVDLSPPQLIYSSEERPINPDRTSIFVGVWDNFALDTVSIELPGESDTSLSETFEHQLDPREDNTTSASLEFDISAWALSDGENELRVVARDAAGNLLSTSIMVSVDQEPPVVALMGMEQDPPEPVIITDDYISVSFRATDNDEVMGVSVSVDGAPVSTNEDASSVFGLDLSTYLEGEHTLEVVALDRAGNRSEPASMVFELKRPSE